MNGLQSSLYGAAIALCVFSAGIMRDRRSRAGRLSAWFMSFLVIETLAFAFELLMVHPDVPLKGLWLGLRMATSLLVAPCLWLAVRECVEEARPRLSGQHWGHYAAIIGGMSLLLPLIGSAHLGLDYPDRVHPVSALHSRVIHGTMLLCIAIFAVQVPYYLWQCRRLLLNPAGATTWLQLPLGVVFTTWALGLLRTLQCATHAPREFSLLFALTDVGVTVGAMYSIVRRLSLPEQDLPANPPKPVVRLDPVAPESTTFLATPAPVSLCAATGPSRDLGTLALPAEKTDPGVLSGPPACVARSQAAGPVVKYARSCLDAATRERIVRKLEAALATKRLYRDSLLNLRSLSRSINEKAHYVSQVINQDLNVNFYALVNQHRIEQAKRLLTGAPDQTVLEIALAVGFNSKSTFNTAFRQNTGMTPSEYRAAR